MLLLLLVVLLVIALIILVLLTFMIWRSMSTPTAQLERVVNQVFALSAEKITQQSHQVLANEREVIQVDLANKQHTIEQLVKSLREDVATRQQELQLLERERRQQFGEMVSAIEAHRKLTDELRTSTHQLAAVLSNNQARGEWGERIIEDLLEANGLVEGVHYRRQLPLGTSSLRPDITLLLPNERVVAVDVKFPYSEIQKMTAAESKAAKEEHLKQFARDLRSKVAKVAEYIQPESNTLDYAILFVPNEMVFSFINQRIPEVVDEALRQRVILVSPFTFLIVARTVLESYRNFMIGDRLREVVHHVDDFVKEWQLFRDKFAKYGRSLETLRTDYEDLSGTRVRQMEKKIIAIEHVRQGTALPDGKTKATVVVEKI